MKRVLVLTYHFPPEGGPAVQRVLKFVKYLPSFGYEPVVLTSLHPLGVKDHDLFKEIPISVPVHRVIDFGAWIPYEVRKRIFRNFLPDRHITWKKLAISKALRIIQDKKIDLLFSSSPPHSVQVIAKEIATRSGLPWVADLRDEWTRGPQFQLTPEVFLLEKRILQSCQALTTVTQSAQKNFLEITEQKNPVYFLPNGYDPEDIVNILHSPKNNTQKLNIMYCGRFSKTHSPQAFWGALQEIVSKERLWKHFLRVQIVGGTNNAKSVASFPELRSFVECIPYQPHRKALKWMQQADVLLLLSTGPQGSEIITGKVYEYMALEKPILAVISSPGELSQMLSNYGNAYISILSQENPPVNTVKKLLHAWKEGKLEKPVQREWVQQFDRKRQAKELAKIFDNVLRAK